MANAFHIYLVITFAVSAVSGFIFGVSAFHNTGEQEYLYFPLASAFATGLVTYLVAWPLVVAPMKFTYKRGVWGGIISGILGHPAVWATRYIYAHACYRISGGCTDMYGEKPLELGPGIVEGIITSGTSLLLFGWLTMGIGAYLGYKMIQIVRRLRKMDIEEMRQGPTT